MSYKILVIYLKVASHKSEQLSHNHLLKKDFEPFAHHCFVK